MANKAGLHNPSVIDLVTINHEADDVRLIMIQIDPWDGSPNQDGQLQEKTHNYVSFALDGQLVKSYPEAAGRQVTIQLDCPSEPEGRTAEAIAALKNAVEKYGLKFEVNVLP